MSPPPELRALCRQIETTPPAQLVHVLGSLQTKVLRCRSVLSATDGQSTKAETTETSVLVHKLKTQIQTLLNDRKPEARLAAVVLVKSTIDVGSWMVLKDSGKWIMGLLSILSKPDPYVSKKLCIIALTSIFSAARQFQSLVREIITPNLPTFVTKCLELAIVKGSGKLLDVPYALVETIFNSFALLVAKHPAIFRSFKTQIESLAQHYAAPTVCDQKYVPVALQQSASRVLVLLHQTAPKLTGGDEWAKAIRELINLIHQTADVVFRSAIEDWESSTGYVSKGRNVTDDLSGGDEGNLPEWAGIDAGLERLRGLLNVLAEYCRHPTSTSVTIPLAMIEDVLFRMLSIAPPLASSKAINGSSRTHGIRMHPAIDREEKDGLWSGLPAVQIASVNVYRALLQRIGASFMPLANSSLEHTIWLFRALRQEPEYRSSIYDLLSSTLPFVGPSMSKLVVGTLNPIIEACIDDCSSECIGAEKDSNNAPPANGGSSNADSFLGTPKDSTQVSQRLPSTLSIAAKRLLPLFITYLPPAHMNGHQRAAIDRAAILSHNKDALLASILEPHRTRTGQTFPSVLPHLCQLHPTAPETEALIRPRFPPIAYKLPDTHVEDEDSADEDDMSIVGIQNDEMEDIASEEVPSIQAGVSTSVPEKQPLKEDPLRDYWATATTSIVIPDVNMEPDETTQLPLPNASDMVDLGEPTATVTADTVVQSTADDAADDSDDSSIALVMEFNDSSDEEEVE